MISMSSELLNNALLPGQVILEYGGGEHVFSKVKPQMTYQDMAVELQLHEDQEGHPSLKVLVLAERSELRVLRLSWERPIDSHCRFCGDEWGAGDGTSQWRTMDPRRIFPWYVLIRGSEETSAIGVMTQAAAFASWNINPSRVTLTLDIRNGACGVKLDGRALEVATVLFCHYERTPMATARRFCGIVSPAPITANLPVYGIFSRHREDVSFDQTQILRECDMLANYCNGLTNRPFHVVECGWQTSAGALANDPTGPWKEGNAGFQDMGALSDEIRRRGVRPGISMRLLRDLDEAIPANWYQSHRPGYLDPSIPEVLEHIQENVRRAADWGFEMIRHISSTKDCLNDIFRNLNAPADWHFADQSRTNAEILADFYRAIKSSAGDMVIYGEDVIGHLAAGLTHVCRVAQEAPNGEWLRGRHNRVNALAFRLCQNQNFFTIDAGTIEISARRKWQDIRALAELLANSDTAFFLSFGDETPLAPKATKELMEDFFNASLGDIQVMPTDWMDNTCPEEWTIDGKPKEYHWFQ